jgi:hypothetical protein
MLAGTVLFNGVMQNQDLWKYCKKGHKLQPIDKSNLYHIRFIVCDVCDQRPIDLKCGTLKCYKCDFDRCDNCCKIMRD